MSKSANLKSKAKVLALFNQGYDYHKHGQLNQAWQIYRQVLQLQPEHFDALYMLGLIAFNNQKFELTVDLLGKVIKLNGNHADALYNHGVALQKLNRMEEAVISFDKVIELNPNDYEAFFSRGNVLLELKFFDKALDNYIQTLKIKPDYAKAYYACGLSYQKLMRLNEALTSYGCAIEIDSNYFNAYNNRGGVLHELNRFDEALIDFDKAIELNPFDPEVLCNRGITLQELNSLQESIASYDRAIKINPEYADAYLQRGITFQKFSYFEEALLSFERAIEINPDYAQAYSNRGNALVELNRLDEALADYEKAIEINPNFAEAYYNRGNALKDLNRLDEAIASYDKAIEINPNYAEAYSNRGVTLSGLNRLHEAITSNDKAIEIKPDYAEAYSNRGVALQELRRIDEAINHFDKAISLDPENAEANHNKSLILLLRGEFKKGWELYKWRWGISASSTERFHTKIPHWDGINADKSLNIFLWAEQGIGDEIFYFGMLKNFFKIDSRVIISSDKRLHGIFKRSMPEVEFIDRKKIDTEFIESTIDFQAPMGDLGYFYSVNKIFDANQHKPFLHVHNFSGVGVKKRNHVFNGKILCGLSWKSANKNIGLSKSLNLIELAPLLLIENIEFVSLQYGSTKDEIEYIKKSIGINIHTIDELDIYNDIDGLLSLISDCDFVITTSNITAHLTGSLGKKGMVLLPFSKGKIWYWHSGEGQSTWYPSLQLASQTQMNDWTYPIQKCKDWILEQI